MLSLTYVSHAKERFSDKALLALLKTCHTNNQRLGVTGLLLYNNAGTFVQVVEGETDTIERLYQTISADGRHKKVHCLSRRPIEEREFPHWKMGFRRMDNNTTVNIEGFTDFMVNEKQADYLREHTNFTNRLIAYFKHTSAEVIL